MRPSSPWASPSRKPANDFTCLNPDPPTRNTTVSSTASPDTTGPTRNPANPYPQISAPHITTLEEAVPLSSAVTIDSDIPNTSYLIQVDPIRFNDAADSPPVSGGLKALQADFGSEATVNAGSSVCLVDGKKEIEVEAPGGAVERGITKEERRYCGKLGLRKRACVCLSVSGVVLVVLILVVAIGIKVVIPTVIQSVVRNTDFAGSEQRTVTSSTEPFLVLRSFSVTKIVPTPPPSISGTITTSIHLAFPSVTYPLAFGSIALVPPLTIEILSNDPEASRGALLATISINKNNALIEFGVNTKLDISLQDVAISIIDPDTLRALTVAKLLPWSTRRDDAMARIALRANATGYRLLGLPVTTVDLYREVTLNMSELATGHSHSSPSLLGQDNRLIAELLGFSTDTLPVAAARSGLASVNVDIAAGSDGVTLLLDGVLGNETWPLLDVVFPQLAFEVVARNGNGTLSEVAEVEVSDVKIGPERGLGGKIIVTAGADVNGGSESVEIVVRTVRFGKAGSELEFLQRLFNVEFLLCQETTYPFTIALPAVPSEDQTGVFSSLVRKVLGELRLEKADVKMVDDGLKFAFNGQIPVSFIVGDSILISLAGARVGFAAFDLTIGENLLAEATLDPVLIDKNGSVSVSGNVVFASDDGVEIDIGVIGENLLRVFGFPVGVPRDLKNASVTNIGFGSISEQTTSAILLPVTVIFQLDEFMTSLKLARQVSLDAGSTTVRPASEDDATPERPWRESFVPSVLKAFNTSLRFTDAGIMGSLLMALPDSLPTISFSVPYISLQILSVTRQINQPNLYRPIAQFESFALSVSQTIPTTGAPINGTLLPSNGDFVQNMFESLANSQPFSMAFGQLYFGASEATQQSVLSQIRVPLNISGITGVYIEDPQITVIPAVRVVVPVISYIPVDAILADRITADIDMDLTNKAKTARVNVTGAAGGPVTLSEGRNVLDMVVKDIDLAEVLGRLGSIGEEGITVSVSNVVLKGASWFTDAMKDRNITVQVSGK